MRPFSQVGFFVLASVIATTNVATAAQNEVPLARVASTAHLQYEWLAATRAVQLSGPGIVLIVRPGDSEYEVNDRVEVTADPPRYASDDIYVSRALANHITYLARQAQLLIADQAVQAASLEAQSRVVATGEQLQGQIVLNVVPLEGAEALLVTGQAPPSAPIRITLLATLSSEIPNILLSRHDIMADAGGKFQAIVPIASDYMRDSFIHVLATSSPGVISASAQLLVHEPNVGIKVPGEAQPGGIW